MVLTGDPCGVVESGGCHLGDNYWLCVKEGWERDGAEFSWVGT